ncbi:MAG: acyl-CoA/acyl-ACP dehydrogenase [Helicobacteraceae bacterium]|jgi:alkylation response protein AidB-like acyl-CoA dehydrogenase|nr:acyl-CoA/acyl-ACP dehydrogenase [Helicobacteraceae bacterium]
MSYYETIRSFAAEKVAPHTTRADKEGRFPIESFEAIRASGYFGMMVPKEFGGLGGNMLDHAEACMALGEYCATTALCYMMHNVATLAVVMFGTDEMKREFLPQVAQGKKIMALAFSETGTGTHFYNPEIAARDNGKTAILNGSKSFVTTALVADEYLVVAPSLEGEGLDVWSVPLGAKGLSFEPTAWDGLGMRGNNSMPMILESLEIDKSRRIGGALKGTAVVFDAVGPLFIAGLAAIYSALAIAAGNAAIDRAKNRRYGDNPLSHIPTVQEHLAKIYALAQSAKALTLSAAKRGAEGAADTFAQIVAARINASDNAVEACRLAMRVGGGAAYTKRLPLERLLRDSYAAAVMAPSVDVLTIWLGRVLTDQSPL